MTKIRKLFFWTATLFLVNFFQLKSYGQNDKWSVVSKTGVFLRENPSQNSKALTSILFLEKVTLIPNDEAPIRETIGGFESTWFKVKYHNKIGYIFGKFLSNRVFRYNPKFPKNFPQLFYQISNEQQVENYIENCADAFYFNPDLNWHGLYQSDKKWTLKKVAIQYEYIKNFDQIFVKTNQSKQSRLLIGMPKTYLDTTSHQYINFVPEHKFHNYSSHYFYPGQSMDLGNYRLSATGRVESDAFDSYCTQIMDYQLRISKNLQSNNTYSKNWKHQNLLQNLEFLGECDKTEVLFVGDLDRDGIPDIILSASSNSQHRVTLFLSSLASNNQILERVAFFDSGNCT